MDWDHAEKFAFGALEGKPCELKLGAFRACCGKVADFADNSMFQANNLARILSAWVIPPKRKAR
jgi:hypothetical protein